MTSTARPQLQQGCEHGIEVPVGAGMQNMELQPKVRGRRLQVSRLGYWWWTCRVDEKGEHRGRGDHLVQNFQPLRRHFHVQAA